MRRDIRFAGYGGQGIALMGMLLGKAAALYDNKEAVFTQSYGPESRGGASNADVVVHDKPIDFPLVNRPDMLIVMFQEAYDRFGPSLKANGLLFLDQDLVKPRARESSYFSVPATKVAQELGKAMVANVVMLGFFTAISGVVSRQAISEAIKNTVRAKFMELNMSAFERGWDWAKETVFTTARGKS